MIQNLFGMLLVIGFFVAFLSIIKIYFFLRNEGREVSWGGAGLPVNFIDYYELTRKKTGKTGKWLIAFFIAFLCMFLSTLVIMFAL